MREKLKTIYHSLISKNTRLKIDFIRNKIRFARLKRSIIKFYEDQPELTKDQRDIIAYFKKNPLNVFPYYFTHNYDYNKIEVCVDEKNGLPYVLHQGKRLYFKRDLPIYYIRGVYNSLLVEQDKQSPHKYFEPPFEVEEAEIFADIGCAEGIISLGIIERVAKVYLFETDAGWIEALKATFEPWKDKVIIVNKFVTDTDNNIDQVTLDSFFANKQVSFLKIDVDGEEGKLLNGANRLLSGDQKLKIALCTYHKKNDAEDFEKKLKQLGFQITFTDGYMVFLIEKNLPPPYLRKGILRAIK